MGAQRHLHALSPEFLMAFSQKIQCPHLLIKASQGRTYEEEAVCEQFLQTYACNPLHQYVIVDGPHHVHLNNPEVVAPHISHFLELSQPELVNCDINQCLFLYLPDRYCV